MSTISTLKELKKQFGSKEDGGDAKWPKRLFIKSGDSIKLRFLQEISQDASNFNIERGSVEKFRVHIHPLNFKKSCLCTMASDGSCWACDQVVLDKAWRAFDRYLVNVGFLTDGGEWEVAVLELKPTKNSILSTLIEAAEEFDNTIVKHTWKYSRSGAGLDTNYSIIPLKEEAEPSMLKDAELWDLSLVYRSVPSVDQKVFFLEDDSSDSWA